MKRKGEERGRDGIMRARKRKGREEKEEERGEMG